MKRESFLGLKVESRNLEDKQEVRKSVSLTPTTTFSKPPLQLKANFDDKSKEDIISVEGSSMVSRTKPRSTRPPPHQLSSFR